MLIFFITNVSAQDLVEQKRSKKREKQLICEDLVVVLERIS